tara:strand:+ start:404 stop:655 length:252 start_codon:yes stop_codon:yes gene_type:complete
MVQRNTVEFLDQIKGVVVNTIRETPKLKEVYITREQTAKMLNISFPTLRTWVKYGYLNSYKLARRVYFIESEVNECIKSFKTV